MVHLPLVLTQHLMQQMAGVVMVALVLPVQSLGLLLLMQVVVVDLERPRVARAVLAVAVMEIMQAVQRQPQEPHIQVAVAVVLTEETTALARLAAQEL